MTTSEEEPPSNSPEKQEPEKKNEPVTIVESTIRLMTRISQEHNAMNLSQGFPNEPPPLSIRLAVAQAVLTGTPEQEEPSESVMSILRAAQSSGRINRREQESRNDTLNQYSPPMGRLDVRSAIAKHYDRIYDYNEIDPDLEVTVTLGATEAVASALRTLGKPGETAVFFEPFHELYPSQCEIFYLKPSYVTLKQDAACTSWTFDVQELSKALSTARILILNSPHNPTGKVFTHDELRIITTLCNKHDVAIITDEIYEHMTYVQSKPHLFLPKAFPAVKHRTFCCNSIGKSASATGWRVGWCIHPAQYGSLYRGVHDQLVVMSPHPMQYGTLAYLSLPQTYFSETLRTRYQARIKLLGDALKEVGFDVPDHSLLEGAYYWFVRFRNVKQLRDKKSPMEAAMFMVKNVGVACVPGDNFYGSDAGSHFGEDYLRFAACRSVEEVKEACRRIRHVLGGNSLFMN
mmetsp:Transcript_32211/g.47394  ORF Transcript_32211/g.47394 Transcript_32211/m.47394 type:complete len:461 (-) Transcript_32211:177-1559(-)|eukprot:CAMPEP_0195514414 /NCGR_PEP_ID=MMETSP0794_2-20130614/5811_1 /TAXON_ID=515487 /ORGANISM="Stephanopyxis turris, Strain CCMP 815" /LENGTH=460 /DNA_ID=CAMNT_0040642657 /DNA_START=137 /DNA_END=1519 /DNA_ORIENTATION=+